MELACPVCNGLVNLEMKCPACSGSMEDDGSLDNFLGPYSPYEEHDLFHIITADESTGHCIHLVHCTDCGTDYHVGINRIRL